MQKIPIYSQDFRLMHSETIFLEAEHLERVKDMSEKASGAAELTWQQYLNLLALIGLEDWLSSRIKQKTLNRDVKTSELVGYVQRGDFKFCVIATEHLLDEIVDIPYDSIYQPELAAHFYVVIEVLEEDEGVIIRGLLRHDELDNYCRGANLQQKADSLYQIPLSAFDVEVNHLVFYCRYIEATAIPLPISSVYKILEPMVVQRLKTNTTKLSWWLQDIFDESWLTIDELINPQANLAFSTRSIATGIRKGKLIDLEVQLGNLTVALLVNIIESTDDKLGVLIQLHPTSGEKYLPANLKLSLISKAGKRLNEVSSRIQDNYIQLKPFRGEVGTVFSIEVSLGNIQVNESFEM
ncbi:MAG: DUF1822 family protein [Scytonematopsis contorta HA4267-MV1]|jgi:hypothetical protein|nr:DUF1822 family protein [Scytonematopsis contorta HA4267-MV1]